MWNDRYAGDPCGLWGRAVFKNIFGMPTPATPTPTPPPVMPDPNSPANIEAQRQAQAKAMSGGRSSTILTAAAQRAGATIAGASGSSKLGSS